MLLTDSLLFDFLIACITIIALLFFRARDHYKYFIKRNIPCQDGMTHVSRMLDGILLKTSLGEAIQNQYRLYPEAKVSGFFQGLDPFYLIRDPELITKVLVKDFSHFYSHGFVIDEEVNPLDGNLFAIEGNKWRTLRKKLTPTFTSGKLKWMYDLMEISVDTFLKHLDEEVGKEIEIKEGLCRLTTDVIGSCAFGINSDTINQPDSEFRRVGKKIVRPPIKTILKNFFRILWPWLFLKLKLTTIDDDVTDFILSITKQTFDHRLKTGEKRNDFIQLLLQLRERGEVQMDPSELEQDDPINDPNIDAHVFDDSTSNKLVINDNVLAAQLFVFFIAGFETSATGLGYTNYLFSKNLDKQELAREEIKRIKAKYGGFTYEALKEMTYLEACIKESTRIYTPLPTLIRRCTKTCELDDGVIIEKGVGVMITVSGVHTDPKYYPEPMEFRPERFLGEPPRQGTFLPFGDGPRSCIAMRFAQMEMKLTMAKLLDRYRIETCDKMKQFEPIRPNPKAFVNEPLNGIWCKLIKL